MKRPKHLPKIAISAAVAALLLVWGSCNSHSSGNQQNSATTSANHANTATPSDTVNSANTSFDLDDSACDKALEENGTEENPLTIGSASEFSDFRDAINDSTNTKTFKGLKLSNGAENMYFNLSANIDLSSVCDSNIGSWIPIGKTSKFSFKGFFDGKNHTISNLYINDSQNEYAGLFGENCGTLKNINLVNINVIAQNYAGGLAGYSFGNERDEKMGTIINCTSKGRVKGKNAGGLVGKINSATISCCINFANIRGQMSAGGVAGYKEYGKITNCINTGTVSGSGSIGGITGSNSGVTSCCINSGRVKGTCYQECDYECAGGVVGYNEGSIDRCINTGSVVGKNHAGGIAGNLGGDISDCYYDKQMTSNSDEIDYLERENSTIKNYKGKLTSEMTSGSLFGNDSIWSETSGYYPIPAGLKNNIAAQIIALPVFFAKGQKFTCVFSDFTVGKMNGAKWAILENAATVNNTTGNVTITDKNFEKITLTVGNGNNIYKKIILKSPLMISSASELVAFRDAINDSSGTKKFKNNKLSGEEENMSFTAVLTADIDLSSVCNSKVGNWIPIGKNGFYGFFSGNGHTISNLYINSTNDVQGLFGNNNAGTIENLNLVNTNIKGKKIVGSLVGKNAGSIINCTNSGNIAGIDYTGGIGGQNNGVIIGCSNHGSVNGDSAVGGIAGYNFSALGISNCTNSGNVTGKNNVGGVAGINEGHYGNVNNSLNSGNVAGKLSIGGVVGFNDYGHITYCTNSGNINGTKQVGGIAGYNGEESTVENSSNSGTVSGDSVTGGLVGFNRSSIDNCSNNGNVNGNSVTGGLVGSNLAYVNNCIITGSTTGNVTLGGVVGFNELSVENCYYDSQKSPDINVVGENVTDYEEEVSNCSGKNFSEMIGDGLKNVLDTRFWIFEKGAYPRVKGK